MIHPIPKSAAMPAVQVPGLSGSAVAAPPANFSNNMDEGQQVLAMLAVTTIGLIGIVLFFLFQPAGAAAPAAPEPEPAEADAAAPDPKKAKQAEKQAAKAKASAERADARAKADAEKATAEASAEENQAAAAAAEKFLEEAAAAEAASSGGSALDTSDDGLLGLLKQAGYDQVLVSYDDGKRIIRNDILQAAEEQSYGSMDLVHDITQVRDFLAPISGHTFWPRYAFPSGYFGLTFGPVRCRWCESSGTNRPWRSSPAPRTSCTASAIKLYAEPSSWSAKYSPQFLAFFCIEQTRDNVKFAPDLVNFLLKSPEIWGKSGRQVNKAHRCALHTESRCVRYV